MKLNNGNSNNSGYAQSDSCYVEIEDISWRYVNAFELNTNDVYFVTMCTTIYWNEFI